MAFKKPNVVLVVFDFGRKNSAPDILPFARFMTMKIGLTKYDFVALKGSITT